MGCMGWQWTGNNWQKVLSVHLPVSPCHVQRFSSGRNGYAETSHPSIQRTWPENSKETNKMALLNGNALCRPLEMRVSVLGHLCGKTTRSRCSFLAISAFKNKSLLNTPAHSTNHQTGTGWWLVSFQEWEVRISVNSQYARVYLRRGFVSMHAFISQLETPLEHLSHYS